MIFVEHMSTSYSSQATVTLLHHIAVSYQQFDFISHLTKIFHPQTEPQMSLAERFQLEKRSRSADDLLPRPDYGDDYENFDDDGLPVAGSSVPGPALYHNSNNNFRDGGHNHVMVNNAGPIQTRLPRAGLVPSTGVGGGGPTLPSDRYVYGRYIQYLIYSVLTLKPIVSDQHPQPPAPVPGHYPPPPHHQQHQPHHAPHHQPYPAPGPAPPPHNAVPPPALPSAPPAAPPPPPPPLPSPPSSSSPTRALSFEEQIKAKQLKKINSPSNKEVNVSR